MLAAHIQLRRAQNLDTLPASCRVLPNGATLRAVVPALDPRTLEDVVADLVADYRRGEVEGRADDQAGGW